MGLASVGLIGAGRGFARTDALLERLVAEKKVAGASIRIAKGGEVLYRRSLGLADMASGSPWTDEVICRAYSMTKPVAAAAVMRLAEQGRVDLDAPIGELIPELAKLTALPTPQSPIEDARPAERPVTVRHVLTHTAGFTNNWSPGPVAKVYGELGLTGGAWFRDPKIGGLSGFAERLAKAPLVFEP